MPSTSQPSRARAHEPEGRAAHSSSPACFEPSGEDWSNARSFETTGSEILPDEISRADIDSLGDGGHARQVADHSGRRIFDSKPNCHSACALEIAPGVKSASGSGFRESLRHPTWTPDQGCPRN